MKAREDPPAVAAAPLATQRPAASSLQSLARLAARCERCDLYADATQTVWGRGPRVARLMVVGEQPGDQEDQRGEPFIGPAGHLLRGAIETLGWSEEDLYITNAVKHFRFELRGKRRIHKTPAQRHILACLYWLEAEIRALKPRAILALGATARKALLRDSEHRSDGIPVVQALHPAALLRLRAGPQSEAYRHWLEQLRAATPYLAASQPDESSRAD